MTDKALVLGGGGVTGIAWELGVLRGLAAAGVDLMDADVVVGTSAGSVVGSQVGAGAGLRALYSSQVEPQGRDEQYTPVDPEAMLALFGAALAGATDLRDIRRRIGGVATTAPTEAEEERVAVIADRLPSHEWPRQRLLVTAIDVHTGERVAFDRDAGVPLVRAVAASCAVPGVWPPVTIDGRRFMDGGIGSAVNADLLPHADVVVVVAPIAQNLLRPDVTVADELSHLGTRLRSIVVCPDADAVAAIGPDSLDPSRRAGSARAGRAQGQRLAAEVGAVWSG